MKSAVADTRMEDIKREQAAFDAQLPTMVLDHENEFVLFAGGKPIAFFASYQEAYSAGLREFGLKSAFLVSEVKQRQRQSASLAWDAGVMFLR